MARTNNLTNFLTDVATAIKNKKGSQTSIPAANFDTEILALPSQGTYEERTINITQNGTQTITPASGYDAIDELVINTAVPDKQLQTKTYTFTQNANLELTPDTGYDGFDQVNLNINVPTSGSTSNIYKFASLQEAQAKSDYNVGDIAVIMGEKRVPFYPKIWRQRTVNTAILKLFINNIITFTSTPTIDESYSWTETYSDKEYTCTISIVITASSATITLPIYFDGNVTNCVFCWTSQDGLNYTYSYGGNTSTVNNKGKVKTIDMANNTTRNTLLTYLLNNWQTFEILSRFFSYINGDIINEYYRYDGILGSASSWSDFSTPFYPYDMNSVVTNDDGEILDILPNATPYTIDTTWFTNYTDGENFVKLIVDNGTTLYLISGGTFIIDKVNNRKFIATGATDKIHTIDKTTKTVTEVSISRSSYYIIGAKGTSTKKYSIAINNLEDCIIYSVKFTANTITAIKGVPISIYINNIDNNLSVANSHQSDDGFLNYQEMVNYSIALYPYTSLSLIPIKKPDIDMCMTLVNSLLGVS